MNIAEALERYGERLGPMVTASTSDTVLRSLRERAAQRAHDVLTDVYLARAAHELADELAGQPLADARAAAEPHDKAIREAEGALLEAERSFAARMVDFWKKHKPGDASPPSAGQGATRERQALAEASEAGRKPRYAVRSLEDKIRDLRAVAGPDPDALAVLARALSLTATTEDER